MRGAFIVKVIRSIGDACTPRKFRRAKGRNEIESRVAVEVDRLNANHQRLMARLAIATPEEAALILGAIPVMPEEIRAITNVRMPSSP